MRRARLSSLPALLTAAILAALAAPALAEQSPLDQYQSSGTIDPCNPGIYSTGAAPNDVQQYAPDYLQALQDARNKGCRRGGGAGGVSTTPAAAAPSAGGSGPSAGAPASVPAGTPYVPKPPVPPKAVAAVQSGTALGPQLPLAAKSDGGTPAPIVALAVMFLLALVGGALAGVARHLGWTGGMLDPVRHAGGEAALRMGSAADRLRDLTRRRG
ncbi:MAG: hypothetical protein E6G30_03715 [Actinobacteria bacterium]|nr:MAG: hypothetical protein E6G30_03715 [Actinomycetota bacterium]